MTYTVLPPPRHLRRAWYRWTIEHAVLALRVQRDGTGPTEYLLQPLNGGQTFWYSSDADPPLYFDEKTAGRELAKRAGAEADCLGMPINAALESLFRRFPVANNGGAE